MIFLMDDVMQWRWWRRKLSWCRITLSPFFVLQNLVCFFTWSDLTQQYGMVRYYTTVTLVHTIVLRRWPQSFYHTQSRLLKSRVFDTRSGAKMRERIIIQRSYDFPRSYSQRKFSRLKMGHLASEVEGTGPFILLSNSSINVTILDG